MIIVLVSKYKTESNPYVNGFVHTRVMSYLSHGVKSKVFVLNNNAVQDNYTIDGVEVIGGNSDDFKRLVESIDNVTVCIHFINSTMIKALNELNKKIKTIVFVHGDEALHWYQRIFKGVLSNFRQTLAFIKHAFVNTHEISSIRKFIKGDMSNYTFVAVSKWMKDAAEKTWKCEGKLKWEIIPNIVDTNRFIYHEKNGNDRFRLLSIRPFSSGKYANDITRDVVLSLKDEFENGKISMTWVGDGRLYDKTMAPIMTLKNLTLDRKMLQQKEIPGYHQKAGIFICPTRQDAQGVSMCEAMASGLVPVTLWNTAIPEFLPNEPILKCSSAAEMKNLVMYLLNNEDEFLKLSKFCSEFVQKRCGYDETVKQELSLVKASIKQE